MPKQSPIDQLDDAIGRVMSNPGRRAGRLDPAVAALLKVAGELRDLPRPEFKARLKSEFKPGRRAAKAVARAPRRARTARAPQPIRAPLLHPSAIPCLVIKGAARAIEFYKRTFGAIELSRHEDPQSGKIWHAEIQVGNTPIALADEEGDYNLSPPALGGSPVIVGLNVDDPDAVVERAVAGGARVIFPVADQFYGQRGGRIADPFGHIWIVSKTIETVPPDEMRRRSEAYAAEQAAEARREEAPAMAVKPVPEGFHSITPYLQVDGAARLIDFLKRAFGAEEVLRVTRPDGKLAHAQMKVSGSMIELADAREHDGEPPQFKPMPTAIWLFVDDTDAAYKRALAAGATSIHEPMDQDYGNREASVKDPFGNHWYIATPLPDAEPWPEELRSVTPYIHPIGAAKLIDFMKDAFDAEVLARHEGGGVIQHAQVRIGDSIVAMGEAHGPYGPMPPALHLYVPDADAVYNRALRAGAKTIYAPYDAPYGERSAGVSDPFGNVWYIATHQREVPVAQLESAAPAEPESVRRPGHIMPFVYVDDTLAEAEFCKTVFGATETHRVTAPDGRVSHLQLAIDDTRIMLRDANTADLAEYRARGLAATPHSLGASPLHLYIYVPDADMAFKRAVDLGGTIADPLEDKEWGDRCGGVQDPEGHIWYIATPLKSAR
jgi:PhnB protein